MSGFPRGASLRVTLSTIIGVLVLLVVSVVSLLLIDSRHREAERELRHRALLHAEFFASQLEAAVAFDDRQTAKEILSATAQLDRDVEGVGVYRQDGSILQQTGREVPVTWAAAPARPQLRLSNTVLEALAPIASREGPRGVVVLRMSRDRLIRSNRAAMWEALAVATAALTLALLAAWFIAGRVTSRLARVMVAADQVATGNLTQPPLEPGPADEIGRLTVSFNLMVSQLRGLIEGRRLAAAREQRRLSQLVNERTVELALRNEDLQRTHERYRLIIETTNAIPWEYSFEEKRFTYLGPQVVALLGYPIELWNDPEALRRSLSVDDLRRLRRDITAARQSGGRFETELRCTTADGRLIDLRTVGSVDPDDKGCSRGLLLDVTERTKLAAELQQAQKLEAVGRLASGVAHEINTPIQFVNDSVHFIQGAFRDTLSLLGEYEKLKAAAQGVPAELLAEIQEAESAADLAYLVEHVPKALDRSVEGLERVATLVLSMKEFAHPDSREKVDADVNRALSTTLTIARNEYKYVADIETCYGVLPPLLCHVSELNQAFLSIIVNAAHAIGDVVAGTDQRGTIRVETLFEGGAILVSISDTGGGVPEAIRSKIFDPFFTTKAVGKGTGQGLAIARSMVVDKHGGSLTLTSETGKGSTFLIRLPTEGAASAALSAAAA